MMRYCNRCAMPETFPGISFNPDGICAYCMRQPRRHAGRARHKLYIDKLKSLLCDLDSSYDYHVLVAYSGGKDSSYSLLQLKNHFAPKMLAATFDNGFLAPQAYANIKTMTKALNIDHLMLSPAPRTLHRAFLKSNQPGIYPEQSLRRASAICLTCIGLIKSILLKIAIEKNIPFICYGWSPGQIPVSASVVKLNGDLIRKTQEAFYKALHHLIGDEMKPYILKEEHYRRMEAADGTRPGFYFIQPLVLWPYNEEQIVRDLAELGWKQPADTDANSSNCLLNTYACFVHQKRFGFHPYAFELSGLVRNGCLSREVAIKRLTEPLNDKLIKNIQGKLES